MGQHFIFDPSAPKKPTNVSLNSDLVARAKAHGINLSEALEQRLIELVREAEQRAWLEENRAAIEAYNRRVEAEGLWNEDFRTW